MHSQGSSDLANLFDGGGQVGNSPTVWDQWVESLPHLYNPWPNVTMACGVSEFPFRGFCPQNQQGKASKSVLLVVPFQLMQGTCIFIEGGQEEELLNESRVHVWC